MSKNQWEQIGKTAGWFKDLFDKDKDRRSTDVNKAMQAIQESIKSEPHMEHTMMTMKPYQYSLLLDDAPYKGSKLYYFFTPQTLAKAIEQLQQSYQSRANKSEINAR